VLRRQQLPWNSAGPKIGCWYTAGTTPANYAGNFYNPGNSFQAPGEQYPYAPTFGNVFQQSYGKPSERGACRLLCGRRREVSATAFL